MELLITVTIDLNYRDAKEPNLSTKALALFTYIVLPVLYAISIYKLKQKSVSTTFKETVYPFNDQLDIDSFFYGVYMARRAIFVWIALY